MLFVLVGLRIALALPVSPQASWVFDFSLASWRTVRLGVERTMLALGVAPVTLVSSLVFALLWGPAVALTHACLSTAVGLLLVQLVLYGYRGMPCTGPWNPGGLRLRALWPVYLLGMLAVTNGIPYVEVLFIAHPVIASVFIVWLLSIAWLIRRLSLRREPVAVVDATLGDAVHAGRLGDGIAASAAGRATGVLSPTLFTDYHRRGWTGRMRESLRLLRPRRFDGQRELRQLGRDLSGAWRQLRFRPAFTLFAVATIAAGVGTTATIYAVAYEALLKPPAIRDIDRVVNIYNSHPFRVSGPQMMMSRLDYRDFTAMQRSYSDLASYAPFSALMSGMGTARSIRGEAVSGNYFQFVGAQMTLGRAIHPVDDEPGATPVVVMSERLWRSHFASDPGVVGRPVMLNGHLFDVIGVAASSFAGMTAPNLHVIDAWAPLGAAHLLGLRPSEDRRSGRLLVKGRLAEGVTVEHARAELSRIARHLDRVYPLDRDPRYRRHWYLLPAADVLLVEPVSEYVMPLTTVVMAGVGLVLLVACTNLANLTLARGAGRRHDIAVRMALGASRRQLIQAQVLESALVAVAGGLGALWLSRTALHVIETRLSLRLFEGIHAQITPALTPGVWLVLIGSVAAAVIVCGVWPAWQLTSVPARQVLAGSAATVAGAHWRGRQVVISAQVSVSVVLIGAAALFAGAIRGAATHDAGLDLDRLAVLRLEVPSESNTGPEADPGLVRLVDRVRRQRGVEQAAIGAGLPFGRGGQSVSVPLGSETPHSAWLLAASPEIFATLGVRLLEGRPFGTAAGGTDEVVLNETGARMLFGRRDVVGQRIPVRLPRYDANPQREVLMTVTGVAADTDTAAAGRPRGVLLYAPLRFSAPRETSVLVRTSADAAAVASSLRLLAQQVLPNAAVLEATTGAIAGGLDRPMARVTALTAIALGGLALILAMTGLFGVLSQRVADRQREIGIHAALGASRGDVVRLVLRDAMRPVGEGLVLGGAAGMLLRASLQPYFPHVIPIADWTLLLLVPVLLAASAAAACYLPARRATALAVSAALRSL
jgi:predicted permease